MGQVKILLATDSYHSYPTANGICVEEIADELLKQNFEVHILCFRHEKENIEDICNGIYIHKINMDIVNKLRFKYEKNPKSKKSLILKKIMITINRIQAVLFIHWFPLRNPLFCSRYLKKMKKLQKQYKYDIIIGSYCPFEAAYAVSRIKENDNVVTGLYCLDSFTNLKKRFFMTVDFQDKRAWKWEKLFFEKSDFIINLNCHREHYKKERYKVFSDKMYLSDIPHIIKKNYYNSEENQNEDKIRILYAGALRDELIKPLLEYLEPFLCEKYIYLDIYGRSTGEFFDKYCTDNVREQIHMKGFVQHDEIIRQEYSSDILLSLGNSNTDFIPSKIFEYISLGKKILHIYSYSKDSALPYYEKYNNCCCININDDSEYNKKLIKDFLKKPERKISFEEIENVFIQNTPGFTVDIIKKYIKKK